MDNNEKTVANGPARNADERKQRSAIGFPYADLDDAEQIAHAIQNHVGSSAVCEDDQLAAWINMSPKSSGFRTRIYAARMFGVIESAAGGHKLSELGKQIVDPQRQRAARVEAFLNVPLFSRMYEEHKGGVLPPPAAFERSMEAAGVAPKQRARARQVLERSAETAGFFEQGKNRLVKPGIMAPGSLLVDEREDGGGVPHGAGSPPQDLLDPMLRGLFDKLPRGETVQWKADDRVTWLKAATVIFQLVYGADKEIDVFVKGTRLHFGGGKVTDSEQTERNQH